MNTSPGPPAPGRSTLLSLATVFWLAVAWSAVRPYQFQDYLLEIATPIAGFALLACTYRRFPFTTLAYALMFCEALVLVVGAHYTHERVPLFDWLKEPLGLERNHYDRFAHFCVGLFMVIPVRELLHRRTPLRGAWLAALSVTSILGFAAFYEITEWWIAAGTSPETGAAYLGAQGDPWDAQKDMLLDGLGGATGALAMSRLHERALLSLAQRS
jgi:putative membrane protein